MADTNHSVGSAWELLATGACAVTVQNGVAEIAISAGVPADEHVAKRSIKAGGEEGTINYGGVESVYGRSPTSGSANILVTV